MSTPEEKERWKKEANQLKEDLNNRKKIIKKREVEIKFPKNNPLPKEAKPPEPNLDKFYKNQINFES